MGTTAVAVRRRLVGTTSPEWSRATGETQTARRLSLAPYPGRIGSTMQEVTTLVAARARLADAAMAALITAWRGCTFLAGSDEASARF